MNLRAFAPLMLYLALTPVALVTLDALGLCAGSALLGAVGVAAVLVLTRKEPRS